MKEPDLVQRLNAHFRSSGGTFHAELRSKDDLEVKADFGTVYVIRENNKVLYATTETWNNQPSLIAQRGYIYIYSDWRQDEEGNDIPGIKIGDGKRYLIDIYFKEQEFIDHMMDNIRHVTQEDRDRWDNKERAYVVGHELIFTKD